MCQLYIKLKLLLGFICVFMSLGCYSSPGDEDYVASPGNPKISPSGKYILIIKEYSDNKSNYNSFEIRSVENGDIAFASDERFRTRDVLYFLWDNNDRVWVYSGDLGTYYWSKNSKDQWERHVYYYSDENYQGASAPEFLKRVRPKYHLK